MTQQSSPLSSFGRARKNDGPVIGATAADTGLAASHRRALQRPPVKPRRGDVHTAAGGACAEAHAAPGPGGLRFVQAAAAVGRRRAVRWTAMMLMLLQWLLAPTWANAACSTTTFTLDPPTTNFFAPTGSGTFYTGTLTLKGTGCIGGGPGFPFGFYLSFPFGSTASSVPSLPGLKIQRTGAVTHTEGVVGTCSWDGGFASSWTNTSLTAGAWRWTGGTCDVSVTVPVAFSKSAGTLTGSVGPTTTLGPGVLSCGTAQWGAFETYGGCMSPLPGPTTLNFFTPGCTLGVTNTSVTLPTVSKTSLASAGNTAGKKPFTLAINSCSSWSGGTYAVSMAWSFTPVSPTTDVISNTAASPAANVGVQLLDSTGASIANGSSTLLGTVPTSGGASFSKSFYAQYYATGAAGSGGVVGVASITLTYQ